MLLLIALPSASHCHSALSHHNKTVDFAYQAEAVGWKRVKDISWVTNQTTSCNFVLPWLQAVLHDPLRDVRAEVVSVLNQLASEALHRIRDTALEKANRVAAGQPGSGKADKTTSPPKLQLSMYEVRKDMNVKCSCT